MIIIAVMIGEDVLLLPPLPLSFFSLSPSLPLSQHNCSYSFFHHIFFILHLPHSHFLSLTTSVCIAISIAIYCNLYFPLFPSRFFISLSAISTFRSIPLASFYVHLPIYKFIFIFPTPLHSLSLSSSSYLSLPILLSFIVPFVSKFPVFLSRFIKRVFIEQELNFPF